MAHLNDYLNRLSCLGGGKVEGIVIKPANYDKWGPDSKVLMAKLVNDSYKEIHRGEWKTGEHSPNKNKVEQLLQSYRTPARWQKAVQHLTDAGELVNAPNDIGRLMVEIQKDVSEECGEEVRHELWKIYKKDLMRISTRGFPEWYKEQIAKELHI